MWICAKLVTNMRNPLHIAIVKDTVNVLKKLAQENPDAAHYKMEHGETIQHLCMHEA